MIYRVIAPQWAIDENPSLRRVHEGEFTQEQIEEFNANHYNVYFLPNFPSTFSVGVTVEGSQIDNFHFVFVDMDLKDGVWTKEAFVKALEPYKPTYVVDSGRGVHAYWQVTDLDAMSYLKLQRRLCRAFETDEAVAKIYQLMRVPGTMNTKDKATPVPCEYLSQTDNIYTCEQIDAFLAPITEEDEAYCQQHYDKTYQVASDIEISDRIPLKFAQLIRSNQEVKNIWSGLVDDRSEADYRLGHIMFASGFTKEEASSVLVNSAKALGRGPKHRISYATNIVDKIWTFELEPQNDTLDLSSSVRDILKRSLDAPRGSRLRCWRYVDATLHGFRRGQVIGLVAGSGVGKTATALNLFEGFVQSNPDLVHFFVPLEQPADEIAERWKTLCGENTGLYDKVHVISNYDADGTFRHLSLEEIKEYLLRFKTANKIEIGCVVIDHIGALKKSGKDGKQNIEDICHEMKAFAIATNTLLVMQSQTSREKAGIGDLELNKDAAYGTVYFESYTDFMITMWQPLKRCYNNKACPTVTAFKFCKIRKKNRDKDEIQEDVCYKLFFDPSTERLRELTQAEEESFKYFNNQAVNLRKKDRKTDLVPYESIKWTMQGMLNDE